MESKKRHYARGQEREKEKKLKLALCWLACALWAWLEWPSLALASEFELQFLENSHHITADRTIYHSNEKVYEAFGNVVISSREKRLSADYTWIDVSSGETRSRGNVIMVTPSSVVHAAELHYNFFTNTGNIFYGQVTNDSYTLKGQLIRKVSVDRFLTTDGEYSTCRDCSESWKFAAKNVDLTNNGYAFMDSVYISVKDTPTLYIPYVVLPVKHTRQSGLLFPRFSAGSTHGIVYVQPLFITLGKYQDMTLSYGTYSKRGRRAEFEYRYKSYDKTEGTFNAYYLRDRSYQETRLHRYAFKTQHDWRLWKPAHIKWRFLEASDREYLKIFSDIPGNGEPALESGIVNYSSFDNFFVDIELKRYRNLLHDHPYNFDGGTVQAQPSIYYGVKDRNFGPVLFGLYGRFDDYRRIFGGFQDNNGNKLWDPDASPSEWIRETKRSIVTPHISLPFRVGKRWSISPTLEYNRMDYRFNLPPTSASRSLTTREYLVGTLETSTELERIYNYDGELVSKVKHQLIPKLTYSNIPWQREDATHPFSTQIKNPGGAFDQFDIVPVTNSTNFTRLPMGNSISYGFTSKIIAKDKSEDEIGKPFPYDVKRLEPKIYTAPINKNAELNLARTKLWDKYGPNYSLYHTVWDFSLDQAFDFREAHSAEDKARAFSRLFATSNLKLSKFTNRIEWTYLPRQILTSSDGEKVNRKVHNFSSTFDWQIRSLGNSRNTLYFRRSIGLTYARQNYPDTRSVSGNVVWSLNDYIAIEYSPTFDLIKKYFVSNSGRFVYNSVSECWNFGLRYSKGYSTSAEYSFELGVNLFGSGYMGLNQAVQQTGVGANLGPLGGGKL